MVSIKMPAKNDVLTSRLLDWHMLDGHRHHDAVCHLVIFNWQCWGKVVTASLALSPQKSKMVKVDTQIMLAEWAMRSSDAFPSFVMPVYFSWCLRESLTVVHLPLIWCSFEGPSEDFVALTFASSNSGFWWLLPGSLLWLLGTSLTWEGTLKAQLLN